MNRRSDPKKDPEPPIDPLKAFRSPVIDRLRRGRPALCWSLPKGQIVLPRVFGFCRGVERALVMAGQAAEEHDRGGSPGRLVLLGEIIHNPWVNDFFRRRGARILTSRQCQHLQTHIRPQDCAVIPAFGVPLPVERRLRSLGCRVLDCSCGDVRRLWTWSRRAAADGFGLVIFGRARHDETVVTKSRLADQGGKYAVAETLSQVERLAELIVRQAPAAEFRRAFDADATNAECLAPFERLAQVSQTTMLHQETLAVREILQKAFETRFGAAWSERLCFQPTVCRATQDRQDAAVELCRSGGCDVVVVVGGFGSSNTRHLYELARRYVPAYLIEDARAIRSAGSLLAYEQESQKARSVRDWLPDRRPIRIGVLAGASSPEVVVGEVLERLASFLET